MRAPGFLIIALLLLQGCSAIVTRPEVKVQGINMVRLDTSGVDIDINLLVSNPNRFDLALLGYSYRLQLADIPLMSGGERQKIVFQGDRETLLKIPARVRHTDLLELLRKSPDPNHLPYRIIAGLQVDTPIGETSVPVDHSGEFSVPEKYKPASMFQRFKGIFEGR